MLIKKYQREVHISDNVIEDLKENKKLWSDIDYIYTIISNWKDSYSTCYKYIWSDQMNYDIRTPDLAFETFHKLMSYKNGEFINRVVLECSNDLDVFIQQNIDYIKSLDISNLRFIGFHVTTSTDFCSDIRSNGIRSLRKVLSEKNALSNFLLDYGLEFDMSRNLMIYNGKIYDVNYSNYSNLEDSALKNISHKLCYDP